MADTILSFVVGRLRLPEASELLLKLLFADRFGIGIDAMLRSQRQIVQDRRSELAAGLERDPGDLVVRWRVEMATAAERFVDSLR